MNDLTKTELNKNDITIPNDVLELIIVNQFLISKDSDNVPFLQEFMKLKYFQNESYTKLYSLIQSYYNQYQKYPSIPFINVVLKHDMYDDCRTDLQNALADIEQYNSESFDGEVVKKNILDYVKSRASYYAIMDNIDDIENKRDVSKCLADLENIIKMSYNDDMGVEFFKNLDKFTTQLQNPESKIPFLYRDLDRITYGGVPSNDQFFGIIMAQPGLGKSQIMINFMYQYLKQGKKVLAISLEMSEHMYQCRMASIITEININNLNKTIDGMKRKIVGFSMGNPKSELHIKEFATGTLNCQHLKQFIDKKQALSGVKFDVVFVDYVNIMKPNSSSSSQSLYEKCTHISEELRALSKIYQIPFWSATQVNRSGYDSADVGMGNTSESSGINATADLIFAAFQLQGEREQGKLNLKVIKNRLGGFVDTVIPLRVDYETLRIFDWTLDESNEEVDVSNQSNGEALSNIMDI